MLRVLQPEAEALRQRVGVGEDRKGRLRGPDPWNSFLEAPSGMCSIGGQMEQRVFCAGRTVNRDAGSAEHACLGGTKETRKGPRGAAEHTAPRPSSPLGV